MLISISATKDQAEEEYTWMQFDGARGREVSQRTHQRKISKGTVFGIKSLRNGARFTLIFPDLLHINFPLTKEEGMFLLDRSKKQAVPELAERNARKTRGVQSAKRQQLRRDFGAPRFSPNVVPAEMTHGIDLENYQWRLVTDKLVVTHTKGREVFLKNELLGLRFLQTSKGGIVVNREGLFLKVSSETYDAIVQATTLIPIQEWPNGFIDVESMKMYKRDRVQAARNALRDTSEAIRLQHKAERLQQQASIRLEKAEKREREREEEERLESVRQKLKSGQMQPPERPLLEELPPELNKEKIKMGQRLLSDADLLLEEADAIEEEVDDFIKSKPDLMYTNDDDSTEAPDEYDLASILVVRPVAAPMYDVQSVFDALFNGKDEADAGDDVTPEFDLSGIDSDEEEEDADDEETDDPDGGEGDDSDEDDEDDESDDDESEEADDGTGDDSEDESEDDDADEDESEDQDGAGDSEDDSGDAEDADAAIAEKEAKIAKRYAANNNNVPRSSKELEEGDVVIFNNDKKLRREFVILNVSTHESSDNIVVYRLYNLTDAPDNVSIVRVNRARGQSLQDQAQHVKDLKPGVFNRVYDIAEDMDVDKSPIIS